MNDRRIWETSGNEDTQIHGGPLVTPSTYFATTPPQLPNELLGEVEPATQVFNRIDNKYSNAESVNDDPDGVFVDNPTHFAVAIRTKTGREFLSRWIPISKLTQMTDYHEKGQDANQDDWAAVYLPEGVVYIKYRDIETVTFVSRTWWNSKYGQAPTATDREGTTSRTNGTDVNEYR